MTTRKAAIVGMGCISPLGNSVPDFNNTLNNNTVYFNSKIKQRIAGFTFDNNLDEKISSHLDIACRYLLAAVEQAITDAKISLPILNSSIRVAIIIGTTFGVIDSHGRYLDKLVKTGIGFPVAFQQTPYNMLSGIIAYKYGIKGYNTTLLNGWTAGLDAFILGSQMITSNQVDYAIVGGIDILNKTVLAYYEELMTLGFLENNFIPREGCGVVLLKGIDVLELNAEPIKGTFISSEQGCFLNEQDIIDKFPKLISQIPADGIYFANINGSSFDKYEEQSLKSHKSLQVIKLKQTMGECGAASGILQIIHAMSYAHEKMVVLNICYSGQYSMLTIWGGKVSDY